MFEGDVTALIDSADVEGGDFAAIIAVASFGVDVVVGYGLNDGGGARALEVERGG